MEQLKLKSKLIDICDYHSIDISKYAIPLKSDKLRYERDIRNFCKRFAEKAEVSDIESQDMATLSCTSENPKFQKEHITVRVGLGLYSKELEEKIIGMPIGETKTFTVGADSVTVTAEKSIREIFPELTDELVAGSGVPEVKTVEDMYTYCRYKQYDDALEEAADEACAYLAGETLRRSKLDLDGEELETSKKFAAGLVNFEAMAEAADSVEAEDSDTVSWDVQAMADQIGDSSLRSAVLGQSMTALTEEDYEAYLNKLSVAVERPVEDIRREHPLVEYLINTYNEFFIDTVETYVFRKLKEIGESMADEAEN